jgi:MYXO-CTERM domain-containing protein
MLPRPPLVRTTRPTMLRRASRLAAVAALATGLPPAGDAVAQIASNFSTSTYAMGVTQATDIAWTPDGRAIITLRGGSVRVRQTSGTLVSINNAFTVNSGPGEQGLLGVVVDPSFATNQRVYFYASDGGTNANRHRVRRATLTSDNMLMIDSAAFVEGGLQSSTGGNHNGGGMIIHNGHLYIGVGDTGYNATPPTNKFSSCLNVANGKILRVQLSDGMPPADNPLMSVSQVTGCTNTTNPTMGSFSDTTMPDQRIYAWGFRNPYRFWVDPMTNLLWVGDVGETTREEISVGPGGGHFGYPFHEGTANYTTLERDCDDLVPSRTCVPPALDYQTGGADGDCVIGGLIPEGCGWSTATSGQTLYFFGDHGDPGNLWYVQVSSGRNGVTGTKQVFGAFSGLSSIRQGPDGGLYIVREGNNSVTRIIPNACNTGAGGAGGGGATGTGGGSTGGRGGGGTTGTGGGGGGRGGSTGSGGVSASGGTSGGTGGGDGGGGGGGCGCAAGGGGAGRALAGALGLAFLGLVVRGRRRRRSS